MDNIHEATRDFQFNQLSLISPTSISGGAHFSKILMNKLPLYIQTPKCKTKQGIVKSGKKMYSDLVFTHDDEEFIQWLETLETTIRKLIFDNRTKWFDIELSEEDIENYFAPTIKIFKSGKMYLLRVNANSKTSGAITVSNMKIYDENEQPVEMDTIDDKTTMITIVEIQGVKCSSKSFQIEIEIKQIMVLKPVDLFQKCIIKSSNHAPVVLGSLPEPLEENMKVIPTTVLKPMEEPPIKIAIDEKPAEIEQKVEQKVEQNKEIEGDGEDDADADDNDTIKILGDDVAEVDLDLDNLEESDTFHLKEKTEVYYEMYREARRKAKLAKSLALSSFMEARRIKNLYMLDDIDDSDSDLEDLEDSGV
jgi:hypothetical protein